MVTVSENAPIVSQDTQNVSIWGGIEINWDVIVPIIILGIIVIIFLSIIWFIVVKIIKKIKSNKKKLEDLEYYKYSIDLKNAHMNKNQTYKYKNPWLLGLIYSRAKIYARTTNGRKFIGHYDGELVKKEGYFLLAVELRHSFFKREIDLVIFPYTLKRELIEFNSDGTIDLNCEGLDETLSSEYFSIPVFDNTSDEFKESQFVNYSNEIMKNFFQEFSHQKAMKDLTIDYTNNVREATEINATIPYNRKTNSNLRE